MINFVTSNENIDSMPSYSLFHSLKLIIESRHTRMQRITMFVDRLLFVVVVVVVVVIELFS